MPRRNRPRKTTRQRQEERRLRVRGVRRDQPDAKKLARAFIAMALAKAEADAQAQAATATTTAPADQTTDDQADGDQGSGGAS